MLDPASAVRCFLALGSAVLLVGAATPPVSTASDSAAHWAAGAAVRIGGPDDPIAPAEAVALHRVIAGARVIAMGESPHGYHEPLVYRNRLIRHLVMHDGLTAVALENGFADTRAAGAYVLGGAGNAADVVRGQWAWGFDAYPANVEMVRWIREWNAVRGHRKVRLYGIDLSGGDEQDSFGRAYRAIDAVNAYLLVTVPAASQFDRATLKRLAPRFTSSGYRALSPADRAALAEALVSIGAVFAKHRAAMIRTTSADAYDIALRQLWDCRQLQDVLALWPTDETQPTPAAREVGRRRDAAMADNTLWALAREGRRGRVLLFQSNSHVSAEQSPSGPPGPAMASTGALLRRALGEHYRVIFSIARTPPDRAPGTIEAALTGPTPALYDVRRAPTAWREARQTMWHPRTYNRFTPGKSFDAIYVFDRLTREPSLKP